MGLYRLGRKAIKTDTRTLCMARYLTTELPAPPDSVDWSHGQTSWGMLMNDRLGDCTIAGALHAIQGWMINLGTALIFNDQDALTYYRLFDGYVPSDPSTDTGGILLDVLNKWKQLGINGHTISAYASVDPKNIAEVKQAIALFGPLYVGFQLPNSVWGQKVWEVTDDNSIDGGHCVVLIGYNTTGPVAISWGALYQMTWEFFKAYFDELYAAISPDWFSAAGMNPAGLNLTQLVTDLAAIR